ELALHDVHGDAPEVTKLLKGCDRLLIGCIKHAVKSPLKLGHRALALSLHFTLPSWTEACIKVSELFLRLNSTDPRWGTLGRALWWSRLPSGPIDCHTPSLLALRNKGRHERAAYLAVTTLGWTLHMLPAPRRDDRPQRLFDKRPLLSTPLGSQCSTTTTIELAGGSRLTLAHDTWRGWGLHVPPQEVHVYTDGSFNTYTSTSSWAVAIRDDWLESNFVGF